jgi:hypothetical protein
MGSSRTSIWGDDLYNASLFVYSTSSNRTTPSSRKATEELSVRGSGVLFRKMISSQRLSDGALIGVVRALYTCLEQLQQLHYTLPNTKKVVI